MTDRILRANRNTVHLGGFSHKLSPAIAINSGDIVHVETYTGYYVYDKAPPAFLTPEFIDICQNLPPERKVGPGPHLLTGPIYVNDAEPGDVLEVIIEDAYPLLPMGFNAIRLGWGALPERFKEPRLEFIPLDFDNKWAEFRPQSRIFIDLHPFFGILGVATEDTSRSSVPPGNYGGNIDNKELTRGSRIFLPVFVPGALFSIGDGHAAQGNGEVNVTAIETSMKGRIKIKLRKDLKINSPFALGPFDLITMGFAPTLDEAFELALKDMIYWLEKLADLSAEDAYVLCSIAADFNITQVVNSPNKGVHGMLRTIYLPEGAIAKLG